MHIIIIVGSLSFRKENNYMALVTCPECGREGVSDTAIACPSCGFPIKAYFEQSEVKPNLEENKADNNPVAEKNGSGKSSNKSSEESVTLVGIIILLIPIILVIWLLGSCSASFNESRKRDQEKYRRTLESGQQKYYNGESMTQEERKAVEDFNNWKSNQ